MSSIEDVEGPARGSLEQELRDIEDKQREVVDLEDKERELEGLQKRVRELRNQVASARADHRRRSAEAALPVIQPREPCSAVWAEMKGGERVRSCGRCGQRVYDLSSLPADEARGLIQQHEGKLPTHLYGRVDGTVTAATCEQPARRKWTPLAIGIASLAAIGLVGGSGVVGYHLNSAPPAQVIELSLPRAELVSTHKRLKALPQPKQPAAQPSAQPPPPPQPPQPPAHRHRRCPDSWFGGSHLGMFLFFDDEPQGDCPEPHDEDARRY